MRKKINDSREERTFTRANRLIEAKHDSTLIENKLLALALKEVRKDEYDRPSISFSTEQLRELTGVKGNGIYNTLLRASKRMTDLKAVIENREAGEFRVLNLIHMCEYRKGVFTMVFTPETNAMLYNLKGNFTTMSIDTLFTFRSNHTYRLYELLKVHEHKLANKDNVEINFKLSDLKMQLNCINLRETKIVNELSKKNPDSDKIVNELAIEKKYKTWYDFRKRVIDPSVVELNSNERVEFKVDFETIGTGRGGKVIGIKFIISRKDGKDEIIEENSRRKKTTEIMEVLEWQVSEADALTLFDTYDEDIDELKAAYQASKKEDYINNLIGWLIAWKQHGGFGDVPMARGSVEQGKVIEETYQKMNEKTEEEKAESYWQYAQTRDDFDLFVEHLCYIKGIDFGDFQKLSATEKSKAYLEWRKFNFQT